MMPIHLGVYIYSPNIMGLLIVDDVRTLEVCAVRGMLRDGEIEQERNNYEYYVY